MVFSSIPAYLDPSNWQQQPSHQIFGSTESPLLPPPLPPPLPAQPHGISGPVSIRPGSMSEFARRANIPIPEAALKCPRCESTNTKFCYFNNYSLTQPRHFCKTCRRYWTRGGAMRSVPVGGGCRRNKRSKSTSSKSSPASSDRQTTSSSTSTVSTKGGGGSTLNLTTPPQLPLRFLPPPGQLTDSFISDMGLSYGGVSAPVLGTSEMSFNRLNNLFLSDGGGEMGMWRLQQVQHFPFLGGLDASTAGTYQFQGSETGFLGGDMNQQVRTKVSSSMLSPLVKMEDNNPELNLSRQFLGGLQGNDHQWNGPNGTNWTELCSFSSSSTINPL